MSLYSFLDREEYDLEYSKERLVKKVYKKGDELLKHKIVFNSYK